MTAFAILAMFTSFVNFNDKSVKDKYPESKIGELVIGIMAANTAVVLV